MEETRIEVVECKPVKMTRSRPRALTVRQQLEVVRRLEEGWSYPRIMTEYSVSSSICLEIFKNKESLKELAAKLEAKARPPRPFKKTPSSADIDSNVYRWYNEQRRNGVHIKGSDLIEEAERVARQLNQVDFKPNRHWLYRWRGRHGVVLRDGELVSSSCDEFDGSRDEDEEDSCQEEGSLPRLLEEYGPSGVFSARLVTLHWAALPSEGARRPSNAEPPLHVLLCSNSDASHRLRPLVISPCPGPEGEDDCIVWKQESPDRPREKLLADWFEGEFALGGRRRAVLIYENCSAGGECRKGDARALGGGALGGGAVTHPPLGHAVPAFRQLYRAKQIGDTFGLQYGDRPLKRYTLKDAVYNIAESWSQLEAHWVQDGWSRHRRKHGGGESSAVEQQAPGELCSQLRSLARTRRVSLDTVRAWLDLDESTESGNVAAPVVKSAQEAEEEVSPHQARWCLDQVLRYLESTPNPELRRSKHYSHILQLRRDILSCNLHLDLAPLSTQQSDTANSTPFLSPEQGTPLKHIDW